MEIKQRSQATTIENLKLETGWEFAVLLIKKKECINNTTKRRRTVSLGPAVLTSTTTTNYMTFPDNSKNESTGKNPKGTKKTSSISSKETEESCCNDEHEHSKSSLRDFFVVLALTFHAILEGIAVGLEEDLNDVWLLFAGLS